MFDAAFYCGGFLYCKLAGAYHVWCEIQSMWVECSNRVIDA